MADGRGRPGLLLVILTIWLLAACGDGQALPTTPADPLAARGRQLFQQNCATCHATAAETVIVGPSLAGIADRAGGRVPGLAARDYIQQSILNPGAHVVAGFEDLMPTTFGKSLTGEELDALTAYLLTLE
jgi:mono/diheme cytochrome c family protein